MKADSPSRLRAEQPRADDGEARTERLTVREVGGGREGGEGGECDNLVSRSLLSAQ